MFFSHTQIWRLFSLLFLLTLGIVILLNNLSGVEAQTSQPAQLNASAMVQIAALQSEKLSRSPTQHQIDSQLLDKLKKYHEQPITQSASTSKLGAEIDQDGRVLVDIQAKVTDGLLEKIERSGGKIINSFAEYNSIRALIPLTQVEVLASLDDINFIQPAVKPKKSVGAVTSEGDLTHRAAQARSTFGVNGTGVKVGVLSDSYNCLGGATTDIINGDLPSNGVTVLEEKNNLAADGSCSGATDEGRAMLQIIHDLAPGARLYFATSGGGPANFANNIRQLRAAGCDVIVDDIEFPNEPVFQDGIITQAVNLVVADGASYFSASTNSGNFDHQTSGVWEGNFVDSGISFSALNKGVYHNFGSSPVNQIISGSRSMSPDRVDLFWSDPLGASSNDYDLYVFDSNNRLIARSENFQTGSQDPYEYVDGVPVNSLVAVVLSTGQPRYLHLEVGRLGLATSTNGRTKGHVAAARALAVAAVDVRTTSPFPSPFTGGSNNPVEDFSSDGPRRIFYNADGTPITPGNLLSTGGLVRQKPDIAAADGVVTTFASTDLNPFFGTSAAAPHAAAIAALLKSFKPSLNATQIRTALTSTALDIETPGVDRDSGSGLVMASEALQFVQVPPPILKVSGDFNSDGQSDLVLRNQATGQNKIWLMNGTTLASEVFTTTLAGSNWQIVGTGDFNSDGQPDLVWRNQTTGQNTIWLMNGTTLVGAVDITPLAGSSWQVGGTGDFNGDGKSDIVWHNQATGQNTIWLMNGTTLAGSVDITPLAGATWQIGGAGDFNGDAKPDLVWHNQATGQNTIWLMNGTTLAGSVDITPLAGATWQIGGTGDFNGDSKSDIAWHNQATGQNTIWLMNGITLAASVNTTTASNLNWQIRGPR